MSSEIQLMFWKHVAFPSAVLGGSQARNQCEVASDGGPTGFLRAKEETNLCSLCASYQFLARLSLQF
jgi:hypothetical protein